MAGRCGGFLSALCRGHHPSSTAARRAASATGSAAPFALCRNAATSVAKITTSSRNPLRTKPKGPTTRTTHCHQPEPFRWHRRGWDQQMRSHINAYPRPLARHVSGRRSPLRRCVRVQQQFHRFEHGTECRSLQPEHQGDPDRAEAFRRSDVCDAGPGAAPGADVAQGHSRADRRRHADQARRRSNAELSHHRRQCDDLQQGRRDPVRAGHRASRRLRVSRSLLGARRSPSRTSMWTRASRCSPPR